MKHLIFLACLFFTGQIFAQTTATVPLNGSVVSRAADATSIIPKWSIQSGSATITNPNILKTTAIVPIGVTVFQLVGTDNFGTASAPAYKKVTVYRNNLPPVMDAGQDTTIQLGKTALNLSHSNLNYYGVHLVDGITYAGFNPNVQTFYQEGLTIKVEDIK